MRVLLVFLLSGFAASCGQQGPLYLPNGNQAADQAPISVGTAALAL